MNNKKQQHEAVANFFLPDLCHVRAVLFLVLAAQLVAIVLELNDEGLKAFSWYNFALLSLFMQWAVLSSAAILCYLRPALSRLAMPVAAGFSFTLILAVVILLSAAGQWLLAGAFNTQPAWSLDGWALLNVAIICAVLAGITLRYFYLTKQLQLRQQAELEARIQALQSRIRPHFLFNSMNIIASLIAVDQEAAETAVEDLSALFRASLSEVATEVDLEEELALCHHYARIEQLRLGERLQLEWQFDEVPMQLKIPSLTLQPLLENAIYHGIQQLPGGGKVVLAGQFSEGLLSLSVTNPVPAESSAKAGNQIAITNIGNRLRALYGSRASLNGQQCDAEYRVELRYPASTEAVV